MRAFGRSGLQVPRLGLGGGPLGDPALSDSEVAQLLDAAVDLGITLFDLAPSYGDAEARLGRHFKGRRDRIQISTKCGYGVPGLPDWTGATITAGIELALQRLQTDFIDILHLHSCPKDVLERDDILGALSGAVHAGKIRIAAYSGDGEPLRAASKLDVFGSLQMSINLCDQRAIDETLPVAASRGLGVIAKRPFANAAWRFPEQPHGNYAETYWLRLREMDLSPSPLEWEELAARFTVFLPGVHTAIVGTRSVAHLRKNVEAVQRGALPIELQARVRDAFRRCDHGWDGQI